MRLLHELIRQGFRKENEASFRENKKEALLASFNNLMITPPINVRRGDRQSAKLPKH